MSTHSLLTYDTIPLSDVRPVQVGNIITLPAKGPWDIYQIYCQTVENSGTDSVSISGNIVFDSVEGDLSPDPAPGQFPYAGTTANQATGRGVSHSPLNIYDVQWTAAGKSQVRFLVQPQVVRSSQPGILCGLIFGKQRPVPTPIKYSTMLRAVTSNSFEDILGTITLSERATKIVGIAAVIMDQTLHAGSLARLFTYRMDSDDIKLQPSDWPFQYAYNRPNGVQPTSCDLPPVKYMPVDIPVEGGARIDVYVTPRVLTSSVACDVLFYLGYI